MEEKKEDGIPISIKTTRLSGRRSFLRTLGVGLAGSTSLLFTEAKAQRRRRSDFKATYDSDRSRSGDPVIRRPGGRGVDNDQPSTADRKSGNDSD